CFSGQPFARLEILCDGLPEFEILRIRSTSRIHHRQARDLYDTALNRIHEPEIADDPWKRPALWMTAALQVKGRRRKINANRNTMALCGRGVIVDPIQSIQPDTRLE